MRLGNWAEGISRVMSLFTFFVLKVWIRLKSPCSRPLHLVLILLYVGNFFGLCQDIDDWIVYGHFGIIYGPLLVFCYFF